jgi:hypothetical protein
LVPLTQAQLGYQGLYLLLGRATGKAVVLSLWGGAEDARAHTPSIRHQDQLAVSGSNLLTAPGP